MSEIKIEDKKCVELVYKCPPYEKHNSESLNLVKQYRDWLKNYKTYIILNGGTTNLNEERTGTLNQHLKTLKDGVKHQGNIKAMNTLKRL